jgi:hypothetical protein
MFGAFKKIFGGKKQRKPISKMSNYNELSLEELHEKFSAFDFTWMKGDNTGNTERYVKMSEPSPGMKFIVFQGGNRINVDLVDEYMTTFPKAPGSIDFNESAKPNPVIHAPFNHAPPKNIVETKVQSISYTEDITRDYDSPIYKLLAKQKKNLMDVNIKLKINLPSKDLYNVLIESFEGAESEVIDFIINGIEIDEIKKSLADSIKKNYYSSNQTEKSVTASKSKNKEVPTE